MLAVALVSLLPNAVLGWKSNQQERTVVPEWVMDTDKIILPEVTDGDRRRGPDPDKAMCKVQRKMNCKEGCPSGWEYVKTTDYGCCASWTSCGGNRKTCQYEYNCPPDLRGTARDPNNEMRRIPQNGDNESRRISQSGDNESRRMPQSVEDVDEVSASVIPEMVMDTKASDGDRRRRPPVAWPQPVCKVRRKMDCKQGCPSGWEHVRTTDYGCCASFGSCFGNRKICQKEVKCPSRRRAGAEGTLNNAE